jgi:hypothetical protein
MMDSFLMFGVEVMLVLGGLIAFGLSMPRRPRRVPVPVPVRVRPRS